MIEMLIGSPKTDAPDYIPHDAPKITSSLHPNFSTSVKVGDLITTLQFTLKVTSRARAARFAAPGGRF